MVDLIGAGTDGDPVAGVILASGERIRAPWVIGADGRASHVARRLRLEKRAELTGEMAMLLAYWRGLPPTDYMSLDAREDLGLTRVRCEDGIDCLIAFGSPPFTRGSGPVRERRYADALRQFPKTLDPEWLEDAERVTELRAAPETMMRGFFRRPSGPGWALVGDAGHFKHPATAQGISDAVEQALDVADRITSGDLDGHEAWRDERASGHYEWSFSFGRFPREELAGPLFDGLAGDRRAAQEFRDSFCRSLTPGQVLSRERLERWFGAAA